MRRGCDVNDVIQYRTKIHNSQNIMIAVDRSFDAIFRKVGRIASLSSNHTVN